MRKAGTKKRGVGGRASRAFFFFRSHHFFSLPPCAPLALSHAHTIMLSYTAVALTRRLAARSLAAPALAAYMPVPQLKHAPEEEAPVAPW